MADTPWLDLPASHPFGPHHLPYGVFGPGDHPAGDASRRVGVRIGDQVLDLGAAAADAGVDWAPAVAGPTLNPLLAAGPATWASVRAWLAALLTDPARAGEVRPHLDALPDVTPCTCRSPSPTTSTSTPASTTPPTSGASSGPTAPR